MKIRIIDLDSARIALMFDRGAEQARSFKVPLTEIGMNMLEVEKAIFSSQGRRGGGSWAPLKSDTVRKKGTTQILRTGNANENYSDPGDDALYKSVTVFKAPGQIFKVSRTGIEFGSALPHAGAMQKGVSKRGIPARPFLKFTEHDQNRWKNILLNHLSRPLRKARVTS